MKISKDIRLKNQRGGNSYLQNCIKERSPLGFRNANKFFFFPFSLSLVKKKNKPYVPSIVSPLKEDNSFFSNFYMIISKNAFSQNNKIR